MSTSGNYKPQFQLKPLALAIVLASGGSLSLPALSESLPTGGSVVFGAANIAKLNQNMLIQQSTDKAIINWDSFNIGKQNRVDFVQNNANSIALNRVTGVSRSVIEGMLNANGKVYLINKNGILFTGTAQINTGGLVASSLDIDDELFKNGSINTAINEGKAAFETLGNVEPGNIVIEAGAQLKTPSGGSILIFAPEISNSGTIETPDGQTLLAASKDKVYLTVSDQDDDYRGLIVEVQTGGKVTNEVLGKIVAERGNITLLGLSVNQNGRLKATTAVDLNGTIRLLARDGAVVNPNATGEIKKEDAVALGFDDFPLNEKGLPLDVAPTDAPKPKNYAVATRYGQVAFGEASVTEIASDTQFDSSGNIKTAPDALKQNPSKVEVAGKTITMQKNSSIVAPSGEVIVNAKSDGLAGAPRFHMGEGSKIDVAGLKDVELDMSRNVLEVELRGNELKDSPLQRNSILYGKKVKVDLRKGTSIAIADISGALAAVKRDVRERMTTGGAVKIKSEGDTVLTKGSTIDVSGGSVKYKSGVVESTKLISNNKIYDISDADPNLIYDTILGFTEIDHPKWNLTEIYTGMDPQRAGEWVEGFTEGKNAGSIAVTSVSSILEGTINANTIVGEYQRNLPSKPVGGTLSVDAAAGLQELRIIHDEITHDIDADDELVAKADSEETAEDPLLAQADGLQNSSKKVLVDDDGDGIADMLVSERLLNNSGLSSITFSVGGDVSVEKGADIKLVDGASLTLKGLSVEHQGNITARGGKVSLQANYVDALDEVNTDASPNTANQFPVHLAQGSRIDVSGRFTNDAPVPLTQIPNDAIAVDAGSVTLQARGALTVDDGAVIDADGGAYIDRSNRISAGKGGDVTLISNVVDGADVTLNGVISSYSLKKGGKLSVAAASVFIGDKATIDTSTINDSELETSHALILDNTFFSSGGFSAYDITANMQALVIDKTANLAPIADSYVLADNGSYLRAASGSDLAVYTSVGELPAYLRAATDISLKLKQDAGTLDGGQIVYNEGQFTIEEGAAIKTDIGGKIALQSDSSLLIDGTLSAAGGSISATITKNSKRDYDSAQSLWLGNHAALSSNAAMELIPNAEGYRQGNISNAGDITLWAQRGFLAIEDGATIEANGAVFTLDNMVSKSSGNARSAQAVAANAGSINLRAAEGILFDGDLSLERANQAGARGGSLTVAIDTTFANRVNDNSIAESFPKQSPVIVLDGERRLSEIGDLEFGDKRNDEDTGTAVLDSRMLAALDLDSLTLESKNKDRSGDAADAIVGRIEFLNNAALTAKQQINLEASTIRVGDDSLASADSAAITLGVNSGIADVLFQKTIDTASRGGGAFIASANLIDVIGNVTLDHVGELALVSKGDIRLRSVVDSSGRIFAQGNLVAAGDINLLAQQVYPTTLSNYRVASTSAAGTITVAKADGTATVPLSAAGKLLLDANTINQQGVLRAPLGKITLGTDTTETVTLGNGSLTSVSADGAQIPLGRIQGEDILWSYGIKENEPLVIDDNTLSEKTVTIHGDEVDLQQGSKVDISGNGDVYATEFIVGPGGSKDVLAGENAGNSFAIVPGQQSGYSPYDMVESRNTSIELGSTLTLPNDVRLADGTVLRAGIYTVLPARYALQDGAFLVTPSSLKGIDPSKNQLSSNGAPVVAGKKGVANTGIQDSVWSGFTIEKGTVALTRSEYLRKSASEYFVDDTALYSMPAEAGHLVVDVGTGLKLDGTLVATHAAGIRGSRVDIAADNLLITQNGQMLAQELPEGTVVLSADAINAFGADSILLGGTRSRAAASDEDEDNTARATAITVNSQSIEIAEDTALQGKEFILAATSKVKADSSARITVSASEAPSSDIEQIQIEGDGALLQVSALQSAQINRTNEAGVAGDLILESDSVLNGVNSVLLDASNNMTFDGSIVSPGKLVLSSKRIVLGDPGESSEDIVGVVLRAAQLDALWPERLTLHSRSDIAIVSDITVAANNLNLQGGNITALDDSKAVFTASGVLGLEGNTSSTVSDGTGTLTFNAGVMQLGSHDDKSDAVAALALDAVKVNINATGGVLLDGKLSVTSAADIQIVSPIVTATKSAQIALQTPGVLALETGGATNPWVAALSGLGATLGLDAGSISINTGIQLSSGAIEAAAKTGDLTLEDQARLVAAGITQQFDKEQVASAGGTIQLESSTGNISTSTGSVIDVSGSMLSDADGKAVGGSRAGSIAVNALQGEASLQGTLRGDAFANAEGGEIAVDAKTIIAFDTLVSNITTGALTGAVDLRQRLGDMVIAQTITAHEISLAADAGNVEVSGYLDARGDKGGSIEIAAGKDAILQKGAVLNASATSTEGRGGKVSIGSSGLADLDGNLGQLVLNEGALINVKGGDNAATNDGRNTIQQGEVHLRARRILTDGTTDYTVAVSAFDASVEGASRIDLEAFDSYEASSVTTGFMTSTVKPDVDAFMSQAPRIVATLGSLAQSEKFQLLPGVEIYSSGDISVDDAIDLVTWRYGTGQSAAPGVLTLRAAGNLNINQSISDGYFVDRSISRAVLNSSEAVLTNDFSWSMNLIGGADLEAAALMSTTTTESSGTADVVIGDGVRVRTGTGDINVAAGGDFKMLTQTSTLYTAGHISYYDYVNPYYTGSGVQPQTVKLPYTGFMYQRYVNTLLPDRFMYPHEGGDISIEAGHDISLAESRQLSSDWLQKYVKTYEFTNAAGVKTKVPLITWGVVAKDFQQGIATLGGGDIDIQAGNDIAHLSVSAPVTIRQSLKSDYDAGNLSNAITGTMVGIYTDALDDADDSNDVGYVLEQNGGGDISVVAGGDILSARVLVDKGKASLISGGDIKATSGADTFDGNKAPTTLSLSDATISLQARNDIDIDAIFNTSLAPSSNLQFSGDVASIINQTFTYSETAGVTVASAAGDIIFSNDIDLMRYENVPFGESNVADAQKGIFSLVAPRLEAISSSGDIYIESPMTLFPSSKGGLKLLAKDEISTRTRAEIGDNSIPVYVAISDADSEDLPGLGNPNFAGGISGWEEIYTKYLNIAAGNSPFIYAKTPTHQGDTLAATIIAADGDIDGHSLLTFYTAQKLYASAGGDITNTAFNIQNANISDTSVIKAGGDIKFLTPISDNGTLVQLDTFGIKINGPGRLDLIAGGDIKLGASTGVVSLGDNINSALSEDGADISVLAGVNSRLDYVSFALRYFGYTSDNAADDRDYTNALVDFVLSDRYAEDAVAIAAQITGQSIASKDELKSLFAGQSNQQKNKLALTMFNRLSHDDQRGFILDVMYSEVRKGGLESLKGLVDDPLVNGTARSYRAIETLFPGADQNDPDLKSVGDISLVFSQIATNDGGSINLFTPQGGINVGLAGKFAGFSKEPDILGVRASKFGDINAVAYDDINVNASRIFALDGGGITLWSSQHDIDAGKGAKTALSLPPPRIKVDQVTGNYTMEFPAASSGSGIQAAVYTPGRKPGSVYLFAPQGVIDAGDAGISSAGDLYLVATKVIGADNISFGGVAIGVPTNTSIASSLTGASDASTASTGSATDALADKSTGDCDGKEDCDNSGAVAFVTVEIIGLGE